MATYKVQGPTGVIDVDLPEGASEYEVIQAAAHQESLQPSKPVYTTGEQWSRALDRGMSRAGSTFTDLIPAVTASMFGFDDYALRQLQEAEHKEELLQQKAPPQYASTKDVKSWRDWPGFAIETVGEQIPNLATIIGTGGLGGAAAKLYAKHKAKQLAKKYSEKEIKQEINNKASKRATKKIIDANKAGKTGAQVGVFLGAYGLEAPETFRSIYEETGEMAPAVALITGTLQASLESVVPARILQGLTRVDKLAIVEQLLKKSGMKPSLIRKGIANVTGGLGVEGLTEVLQEALTIDAEKFVAKEGWRFDSDDYDRLFEVGVRGSIAGGVFRGVGTFPERLRERIEEGRTTETEGGPTDETETATAPITDETTATTDQLEPIYEGQETTVDEVEVLPEMEVVGERELSSPSIFTDETVELFEKTNALDSYVVGKSITPKLKDLVEKRREETGFRPYSDREVEAAIRYAQMNAGTMFDFVDGDAVIDPNNAAHILELSLRIPDIEMGTGPTGEELEETPALDEVVQETITEEQATPALDEIVQETLTEDLSALTDEQLQAELAQVAPIVLNEETWTRQAEERATALENEQRRRKGLPTKEEEARQIKTEDPALNEIVEETLAEEDVTLSDVEAEIREYEEAINEQQQPGIIDTPDAGVSQLVDRPAGESVNILGEPAGDVTQGTLETDRTRMDGDPLNVAPTTGRAGELPDTLNYVGTNEPLKDYLEYVHIDDLIALQGNYGIPYDDARWNKLKQGIKDKGGLTEPIIIWVDRFSRTADVAEGNHRITAAKEMGYKWIPTTVSLLDYETKYFRKHKRDDIIPPKDNEVFHGYFDGRQKNWLPSEGKPSRYLSGIRTASLEPDAQAVTPIKYLGNDLTTTELEKEHKKFYLRLADALEGKGKYGTQEYTFAQSVKNNGPLFDLLEANPPRTLGKALDVIIKNPELSDKPTVALARKYKQRKNIQETPFALAALSGVTGGQFTGERPVGFWEGPYILMNKNKNYWLSAKNLHDRAGRERDISILVRDLYRLPRSKQIYSAPMQRSLNLANSILHEAKHALTIEQLDKNINGAGLRNLTTQEKRRFKPEAITPLGEDIIAMFNRYKRSFPDTYASTNIYEFFAESEANPEVVAQLDSLPSVLKLGSRRTLWDDFMNLLKRLLGFKVSNTMLEDFMAVSPKIDLGTGITDRGMTSAQRGERYGKVFGREGQGVDFSLKRARDRMNAEVERLASEPLSAQYLSQEIRPTGTLEEQITEAREEYIRAKETVEKVKIIDNVRDAGPTYNQPLMRAERKLRDLLNQRAKGPQAIEIKSPEQENQILDDAANLNKADMPEADPIVEESPGTRFEPKTAEELDNVINQVVVSRPRYSMGLMEGLRDMFSRLGAWAKKYYVQLLSPAQIYELFPTLTGVDKLEKILQSRASALKVVNETLSKNIKIVNDIVAKYDSKVIEKWETIVTELSRQNIDPRDSKNFAEPLVVEYLNLPQELQNTSNFMVEQYEGHAEEMLRLFQKINPTVAQRIRDKYDKNKLNFYVPFMRDGDHWFRYKLKMPDGTTQEVVIAAQSPRERNKLMAEARTKEGFVEESLQAFERPSPVKNSFPDSEFNKDVQEIIEQHVADPEAREQMKERVHELFISKFSADSVMAQQRHREGHYGFVKDLPWAYANMSKRALKNINEMEYFPEIIGAMAQIKEETSEGGKASEHKAIYEALNNRMSFFLHPTAQKWASTAGWLNYAWYIGGNMSSAVVNLTQLPIVVYPMLGAEYGMGKALSAMDTARGLYFRGKMQKRETADLPDYSMAEGFTKTEKKKYGDLFDAAERSMTLTRGLIHEATDFQAFGSKLGDTGNTINQGLGWVFKNSERANREITLVAAYDLAMAKGMKREDAIQEAIKLTVKAHSHALPEAGPLLFQQGFGKVAFTFKRFAQAQIYLVSRLFHQAFKGKDARTKRVAAQQLLGIYAGSYAFAGIQGMPFYGAADALASLLFDDEDDPFLLDDAVRDSFGQLGYKGPISQAFNIDIGARTGFRGLMWRADPRRREEVGDAVYFAEHFLGPTWSIITGIDRGINDIENGNITRGVEQMTPTWFRNFVKANRFATEGATTRKGLKISEDPNAYNVFMQIFGFTEADLSESYGRVSSMKRAEGKLQTRKSKLLLRLYLARESKDRNEVSNINEEIKAFNKKVPSGFRITSSTKNRSRKQFKERAREAVNGVTLNSKLRDELIRRYGDEDEDY